MSTITPAPRTDWRSDDAMCERINEGAFRKTLTTHALRHYVRNAGSNGLQPYVRRLGRKILISESGFFEWLSGQKEAA